MKEKSMMAKAAKTVMNAVNTAVTAVQLGIESDSPAQVYEVHFKLKDSYLNDTYRVVLDPNYFGDNSYFVYKGDGLFAELMGFANVIHYDAKTPEAYRAIEEEGIISLKAENLPF
jgi:hypothetical protein